jgi:hypothetical protein
MTAKIDRKKAIREYKERKPERGVYALRCTSTGQVWVGASPNLGATENGVRFMLSHGSHYCRALQSAWNLHGEPAFVYEVLERLSDDVAAMAVKDLLKEKRVKWMTHFAASEL